MNTTHANSYFQTISFRSLSIRPLVPFAGAVHWLRRAATNFKHEAERRSANADEKARQRTLAIYRRNMASLPSGIFRFDPRRDDVFACSDS